MNWHTGMDLSQYDGKIKEGDLIEAKSGMLLVDPNGLMLVLREVLSNEAWEVMYLSNKYITIVDRIDIKSVISS